MLSDVLKAAERYIVTQGVWDSLPMDRRERALKLLLGKNWEAKTKREQEAFRKRIRPRE